MGTAIDAVSKAGGDALAFRDIAFIHAHPERHLEAARRAAVHQLHRIARQLAEASNRELGPLFEISEGVAAPDYGPYLPGRSAGAAMLRAEAADTPISIGSDIITVTVRGVFALRRRIALPARNAASRTSPRHAVTTRSAGRRWQWRRAGRC